METTPISRDSPVCHTERVSSATPRGVLKPGDQTPLGATTGKAFHSSIPAHMLGIILSRHEV